MVWWFDVWYLGCCCGWCIIGDFLNGDGDGWGFLNGGGDGDSNSHNDYMDDSPEPVW